MTEIITVAVAVIAMGAVMAGLSAAVSSLMSVFRAMTEGSRDTG